MKELLALLKDGNSRTVENLASELGTTPSDIDRRLEYLEHIGMIRRVFFSAEAKCRSCSGCGCSGCDAVCKGCMPDNVSDNMGEMWEIVGSH